MSGVVAMIMMAAASGVVAMIMMAAASERWRWCGVSVVSLALLGDDDDK